jgi:hypothetical protein
MMPQALQKSVDKLIKQGRFEAVLPLLEQAAAKMDTTEKEKLIPVIEKAGLEMYYSKAGFFAAGKCYLLAAELAATVFGGGDPRTIQKLNRAVNHFAGPDNHLSDEQARKSAKEAVVLAQRLRAVLERFHPDDRTALADTIVLEVFATDFGDRLSESEYRRVKDLHNQTFKIVAEAYGERSVEFADCCICIAGFFKRNGHEQESSLFRQRHDEIVAALEEVQQ